jgi:hypothetical protein
MDTQSNPGFPQDKDEALPEEHPIPARERPRRKRLLSRMALVAGCLIGLVFIMCVGLVTGILAVVLLTGVESQDEWLVVGDAFMQAMADKDIDTAYSLFAKEARHDVKRSDLATFIDGPFFALFDGYVDLEMKSWYVNYVYPEGTTIEMAGPVYYQERYTGYYEIVLTQEGEAWKLLAINVEVPPEKINSYSAERP